MDRSPGRGCLSIRMNEGSSATLGSAEYEWFDTLRRHIDGIIAATSCLRDLARSTAPQPAALSLQNANMHKATEAGVFRWKPYGLELKVGKPKKDEILYSPNLGPIEFEYFTCNSSALVVTMGKSGTKGKGAKQVDYQALEFEAVSNPSGNQVYSCVYYAFSNPYYPDGVGLGIEICPKLKGTSCQGSNDAVTSAQARRQNP